MTNATDLKTYATLRPETPFNHLFPGDKVPIQSIIPMRPRDETSPLCYLVDAKFLTDEQIEALAQLLYPMWQGEIESIEQAKAYIREGLPLNCNHFGGVSTSDPKLMSALVAEDFVDEYDDDDGVFEPYGDDDYDPIVLYDPVDGAITDSRLTSIVDRVREQESEW